MHCEFVVYAAKRECLSIQDSVFLDNLFNETNELNNKGTPHAASPVLVKKQQHRPTQMHAGPVPAYSYI